MGSGVAIGAEDVSNRIFEAILHSGHDAIQKTTSTRHIILWVACREPNFQLVNLGLEMITCDWSSARLFFSNVDKTNLIQKTLGVTVRQRGESEELDYSMFCTKRSPKAFTVDASGLHMPTHT